MPPTLSLGDEGFKMDFGDSTDDCWEQSTTGSKVDEEMVVGGGSCPPYTRVVAVCSAQSGQTMLN